jgi:para-aminobenzoate synthetase component 1
MRIQFDRGPLWQGASGDERSERSTVFDAPRFVIRASKPEELPAAFASLQKVQVDGFWLAGYMSYELGAFLEPALHELWRETSDLPLLEFGVYDAPTGLDAPDTLSTDVVPVHTKLQPQWDFERYAKAFNAAKAYIEAGDCYQVNLTFPISVSCDAGAVALYKALKQRQPVPFGAMIETETHTVLSRSPELFFQTDAGGEIRTRPMKGTAARSDDATKDEAAKAWLAGSEKNQAENLMIVDLLRNDLSRVSEVGSVKVPSLFEIESYSTVHQMTSTVVGKLLPDVTFKDLCVGLFPCGSITGAPKVRAMEIIDELEQAPRGLYCGSIGWIAPDGRSEFNVAIRTLVFEKGAQSGHLNVGGGLVYDSEVHSEYEEALLKAQFAQL